MKKYSDKTIHIIHTVGMQASGKSTWAEQFIKENQNYKRVNRDLIRHMLSAYTFDNPNENLVTRIEEDIIQSLIDHKYNVIIDKMNLNETLLKKEQSWIEEYCYQKHSLRVNFELKEFPITLAEAIERDSKRSFPIGEKVLKNTWNKYEIELKTLIEKNKPKYEFDMTLPYCIICDIDGTLSNSYNRKVFDFKACTKDIVINQVQTVLKLFNDSCTIFLFSGREEICRKETEEWLSSNSIAYTDLYMRKEKDYRSDDIIKKELFDEYIRGRYNPYFVIDDRISVLNMWQEMGIFTFDVRQDAEGKNKF